MPSPRQGELVGQQLGFGIGENQSDQQKTERRIFQQGKIKSEVEVANQKHRAG